MKTLTAEEVSTWLAKQGQVEDPFNGPVDPRYRIAFNVTMDYSACDCFLRCFLDQIITRGDVLVVVDDAAPAEPSHDFISQALRSSVGEARAIEEVPGYLLTYEDREKAVALFALMSGFRWKCYLYGSYNQIALYNWEGDIFDAWTDSESILAQIRLQVRTFGLKEVEDTGQEAQRDTHS